MNQSDSKVLVFGTRGSAEAFTIRDFLHRCDVPFQWIEVSPDQPDALRAYAGGYDAKRLPLCVFLDGTRLECPTVRQISEKLGLFLNPSRSEYDLAICGAGPAGLSAPVYGASEGLKTVVVERSAVGGQASTSPKIENYLGFPGGISGADLALRAREQACHFGAEILLLREGVRGEFKANSIFLMNIVSAAPAFTTVQVRARRRSASQQITFSLSGAATQGRRPPCTSPATPEKQRWSCATAR